MLDSNAAIPLNELIAAQMSSSTNSSRDAEGGEQPTRKRVDADRYKIGNIPERIKDDRYAAEQWRYLSVELKKLGMLMAVYKMPLMMHCINVSLFLQAHDRIEAKRKEIEEGENKGLSALTMLTPNGYEQMSTDLVNYKTLHEMVMKGADEFGLTPKARAKVLKDPNQIGLQFSY